MDKGYENALKNWVNRMSDDEREVLIDILKKYKKEHSRSFNSAEWNSNDALSGSGSTTAIY